MKCVYTVNVINLNDIVDISFRSDLFCISLQKKKTH